MRLLLCLILIINSSFVAAAASKKLKVKNFPYIEHFSYFDKENSFDYGFEENEEAIKSGHLENFVVDFSPEDHKHHAYRKKIFMGKDNHFHKLSKKNIKSLGSEKKGILIAASANQASGLQRTLIVPVADFTVSANSFMYTPEFLLGSYFSNSGISVNTYFQEVSQNRVSFSGDITELLAVDGICSDSNIFENGAAEFLMNTVDENIDLSAYDRVSFVFPDDDSCLGGALGVGSLGNISYQSAFNQSVTVSFNFNKSAGASIGNSVFFVKVVSHEFGHNFGLKHDNGNACGEGIFSGECPSLEYGGVHSMMGFSPNLAHINSIHKEDLNWLDSDQIQELDAESFEEELTLVPLASSDSQALKMIKLRRNDGSFYAIEYRRPVAMEANDYMTTSLTYGGVQIYLNNDSHEKDSVLIRKDFKDFSSNPNDADEFIDFFRKTSFSSSDEFYDPVSNISINILSVNNNQARLLVSKGIEEEPVVEVTDNSSEDAAVQLVTNRFEVQLNKISKSRLAINFEETIPQNSRLRIKIPKQYKKLIKLKKSSKKLRFFQTLFPVKFAKRKKFAKLLTANANGDFQIELIIEVIDIDTKEVLESNLGTIIID